MTWFKVDDGFYDHPKVDQLPNAAVGLWVKAGSWCSKHETDGVIPAARVKALKGTSSQISALIECGLWCETTTELGAKAYAFRSWFDYQPSRKEREEEREVWREKKRKSRLQKLDNLRKVENVPGGVPEMSPGGTSGGVPEMSGTIPVPSRPVPSRPIGVEVSSQPYGGNAREAGAAGEFFPDDPELDGVALRARQTGVPEAAIRAGVARFAAKPAPKGPGLLHTLIVEAAKQHQAEAEEHAAKQARRAAIEACTWCDQNGIATAETPGGGTIAVKCDHAGPPEPPPSPALEPPRNSTRSVLEMWGEIKTQKGGNP